MLLVLNHRAKVYQARDNKQALAGGNLYFYYFFYCLSISRLLDS